MLPCGRPNASRGVLVPAVPSFRGTILLGRYICHGCFTSAECDTSPCGTRTIVGQSECAREKIRATLEKKPEPELEALRAVVRCCVCCKTHHARQEVTLDACVVAHGAAIQPHGLATSWPRARNEHEDAPGRCHIMALCQVRQSVYNLGQHVKKLLKRTSCLASLVAAIHSEAVGVRG